MMLKTMMVMVLLMGLVYSGDDRLLSSYTTTPTRTQTVETLCASFSDRNSLVDQAAADENQFYSDYMDSSFGING